MKYPTFPTHDSLHAQFLRPHFLLPTVFCVMAAFPSKKGMLRTPPRNVPPTSNATFLSSPLISDDHFSRIDARCKMQVNYKRQPAFQHLPTSSHTPATYPRPTPRPATPHAHSYLNTHAKTNNSPPNPILPSTPRTKHLPFHPIKLTYSVSIHPPNHIERNVFGKRNYTQSIHVFPLSPPRHDTGGVSMVGFGDTSFVLTLRICE